MYVSGEVSLTGSIAKVIKQYTNEVKLGTWTYFGVTKVTTNAVPFDVSREKYMYIKFRNGLDTASDIKIWTFTDLSAVTDPSSNSTTRLQLAVSLTALAAGSITEISSAANQKLLDPAYGMIIGIFNATATTGTLDLTVMGGKYV